MHVATRNRSNIADFKYIMSPILITRLINSETRIRIERTTRLSRSNVYITRMWSTFPTLFLPTSIYRTMLSLFRGNSILNSLTKWPATASECLIFTTFRCCCWCLIKHDVNKLYCCFFSMSYDTWTFPKHPVSSPFTPSRSGLTTIIIKWIRIRQSNDLSSSKYTGLYIRL